MTGGLTRVAESIHWLNRSIERVENVARFSRANLGFTLREDDSPT